MNSEQSYNLAPTHLGAVARAPQNAVASRPSTRRMGYPFYGLGLSSLRAVGPSPPARKKERSNLIANTMAISCIVVIGRRSVRDLVVQAGLSTLATLQTRRSSPAFRTLPGRLGAVFFVIVLTGHRTAVALAWAWAWQTRLCRGVGGYGGARALSGWHSGWARIDAPKVTSVPLASAAASTQRQRRQAEQAAADSDAGWDGAGHDQGRQGRDGNHGQVSFHATVLYLPAFDTSKSG